MATEILTQTSSTIQLPIKFSTQTRYVLPPQRFMLPASWRRRELSQLINKALALSSPVPFDFLVKGILLRTSLEEWLQRTGTGTEETVELEYVESLLPPRRAAHIPHDDWVSAVSCDAHGLFMTGAYDGHLRAFDSSQQLLSATRLHDGPVTSLRVLPPRTASSLSSMDGINVSSSESHLIASTSHDGTGLLSLVSLASTTAPATLNIQKISSLNGHSGPVSALASSSNGSCLLTGGWDTHLALWDTKIPTEDEVAADENGLSNQRRKRRKVDKEIQNGTEVKGRPTRKAPLALLRGHTARVSAVVFNPSEDNIAYSCGHDAMLKSWDTERQLQISSMTASDRPFLSLVHLNNSSPSLLAASSTDRTISVYDTRIFSSHSNSTAPISLLTSSSPTSGFPSVLTPSPIQPNHLASGGSDGAVRIWDIRSPNAPLAGFRSGSSDGTNGEALKENRGQDEKKVLALSWAHGLLVAGGEGGLDIWRVPEPTVS